jgi:hypothetical protein
MAGMNEALESSNFWQDENDWRQFVHILALDIEKIKYMAVRYCRPFRLGPTGCCFQSRKPNLSATIELASNVAPARRPEKQRMSS